jgi:hypothetical protein
MEELPLREVTDFTPYAAEKAFTEVRCFEDVVHGTPVGRGQVSEDLDQDTIVHN